MTPKTVAKLMLVASILMIGAIRVAGITTSNFIGNFGGPDDLPPPGFGKTFLEWNTRMASVYVALVVTAVIALFTIFSTKGKHQTNDQDMSPTDGTD